MMVKVSLDLDVTADAAYVTFSDSSVENTVPMSELINYDYSGSGQLCGVEVLTIPALARVNWDGVIGALNPDVRLTLIQLLQTYGLYDHQFSTLNASHLSNPTSQKAIELPSHLTTVGAVA
jgi:uncharacterized protein YuzE